MLINICISYQFSCSSCVSQRRQWHPTSVLLPGKSHGQRSLVGCSSWGRWGSDTTEWLHFHFSLSCIGEGNGSTLQCSFLENPRDGEPGGLLSMGSRWVVHDWSDLAACVNCQFSNILVLNLFLGTYIFHIQGQRSPSKTIGAGAAAAQHWNDFEEIPHIQGQRRSPSKMVGGAKFHIESNPTPARNA